MEAKFLIVSNYRNDDILRGKFHDFISEVFPSINFKEWYDKGFWTENYIPYSIIEQDKIVSSLCCALVDAVVDGEKFKALQIGAVGTLPEFRNRGLSRQLMELVLNEYKNKIDLFLLFANDSVMDFYPKFGFRNINESGFVAENNLPAPQFIARKLNLEDEKDYSTILNLVNNRTVLTKNFGAENYGFISMWHIINLYRDNLYYLEDKNALFIISSEDGTLHVLDVISENPIDLDSALPNLMPADDVKAVKYYFPPDQYHFSYDKVTSDLTRLFIKCNIEIDSDYFRFPLTAIT